jgi:hypothetical protein
MPSRPRAPPPPSPPLPFNNPTFNLFADASVLQLLHRDEPPLRELVQEVEQTARLPHAYHRAQSSLEKKKKINDEDEEMTKIRREGCGREREREGRGEKRKKSTCYETVQRISKNKT